MSLSLPHLRALVFALTLLGVSPIAFAQRQDAGPSSAPQASPGSLLIEPSLANLRPALAQVNTAVANLGISHWKASKDLRASTQEDVASIQRDLNATLPSLLDQAIASEASLAPSFAVYRNIDALYDVLLRISALASLAGSTAEAQDLEDARAALESGRGQLGNALLQSATARDTELIQLRSRITAAKAAPAVPTKVVVVDDGPETSSKRHRKKPAPASSSSAH